MVTGAGGFLGRYVVSALVARGHTVRAMVRPGSSVPEDWLEQSSIEVYRGDLRSRESLQNLCIGMDCVAHLAAAKSGDFYDQLGGTVIATENLIDRMHEARVNRIVLISSFSVYEYLRRPARSRIAEDSPLAQDPEVRDEYCRTKLLQEQLVRRAAAANEWSLVVLRPGVIFGRDNLWNGRVGFPVNDRWWVCTAPFSTVPLCYVENCAEAVALAVDHGGSPDGLTLNLVDDDLPTHWAYLKQFREEAGQGARIVPVPWALLRVMAGTASLFNRVFFRGSAKLPGLLVSSRLHARCKPMRFGNAVAIQEINWTTKRSWDNGLQRSANSGIGLSL
nr:NAD-dependent epimerase/dehydratase family protein [Thioalkalivibrio sp. XN279]